MAAVPSWENRRLCDDGACTGLIGSDGVCRECGKAVPFWGDERRRGMQDEIDEEPGAVRSGADADGGEDDDHDGDNDDDNERALCPDGACTGLLDDDGRCKVCGKVDPNAVIAMRTSPSSSEEARASSDDGAADDDADDQERKLCPDGACTGLIGDDGACKVCGRRAEA